MCSLFIFESLQNFSLGISGMLKKYILTHVSSAPSAAGRRTSLLIACYLLLAVICKGSEAKSMNADASKKDVSASLNGTDTNNRITGMLEEKNFKQLDSLYSFVVAFVNRAMGEQNHHPVKHAYINFSQL